MTTYDAIQLIPASDSSVRLGHLTARLETQNIFGGPLGVGQITSVEVAMPDGEVLKGDWKPDSGGGAGYGSIYDSVYGPSGSSGKSVVHKGMASLVGDRSTAMQCEFYTKTLSGRLVGACQTSRGDLYRFIKD